MKEKGYDILRKSLQELPVYHFNSEEIWANINNLLNDKQFFMSKQYPEYEIPKDMWQDIEQTLDNKHRNKIYLTLIKIAASIIIFIGSGLIVKEYFLNIEQRSIYTYSTEIIEYQDDYSKELPLKTEGTNHIQAICLNNPEACSSTIFIELSKQIEDISAAMQNLSEKFGENTDPQILRYYYQLENQKIEIELQMLKIINQS